MTLSDWSARHGTPFHHPATSPLAAYVVVSQTNGQGGPNPAKVDLFHLTDYAVSTISGIVVWLVPRTKN